MEQPTQKMSLLPLGQMLRQLVYSGRKWNLYNVVTDSSEIHLLEQEHPEKLKSMIALYEPYTAKNNILGVDKTGPRSKRLVNNKQILSFR